MHNSSIVARLAIWIGISVALSSVITFLAARTLLSGELRERDKNFILQEALEYFGTYQAGGLAGVKVRLAEESRTGDEISIYLRVISNDGKSLFEESHEKWARFNFEQLNRPLREKIEGWHTITHRRGDEMVLDIFGIATPQGDIVQVGMDSDFRDELIENFSSLFLVFAVLSLVLSAGVGVLVARSSLQPLLRLRDSLKLMSESIHSSLQDEPVPLSHYREISEIGEAFNTLLKRINRLIASMRDGLDTIAHEVKSPLTRLRINAERAIISGDQQQQEESLADAIEESERVNHIVDLIMDLAEADGRYLRLSKTKFTASEVLLKVKSLYEDTAAIKDITIIVDPLNSIALTADFERLVQALGNLIDNSIKYSSPHSTVKLSADQDGRYARIVVEDNGCGVLQSELPLVWERLFRGQTMSSKTGLGLGLALVRAIAIAHGGTVSVTSEEGVGSAFSILLPSESSN